MHDPNLESIPEPTDKDSEELKAEWKKRQEDELICRGHILNALSDRLYDLYTDNPSAKKIWNDWNSNTNKKRKVPRNF